MGISWDNLVLSRHSYYVTIHAGDYCVLGIVLGV